VTNGSLASFPQYGWELVQDTGTRNYDRAASVAASHRWAGAGRLDVGDAAIVERLQFILERANQQGRSSEVRALLHSFVSRLQFHAEQGE
jgi:hypothetical protein